jgi:hypothetical protein
MRVDEPDELEIVLEAGPGDVGGGIRRHFVLASMRRAPRVVNTPP